MRHLPLWTIALLLCLGSARSARGGPLDLVEQIFGVSNTNAVAGHGHLTVGVSADGDLTVLSWPRATLDVRTRMPVLHHRPGMRRPRGPRKGASAGLSET